jgi:serine protease Do
MSGPYEIRVRHQGRRSVPTLVLFAFVTSACQDIFDLRRNDPSDDEPRPAPSERIDTKRREPSSGTLEPGVTSPSGTGRIAGVPESIPPPGVSSPPQPSTVNGLKPFSFAPLAAQADPSVATVKAFVRGNVGGRERTLGEGLGTAFVYDAAGFLLTNNHVIEQASEILVGFPDGREFPARVVGADARTDVAVLKIDATGLPALPLGDSDRIQVGEWVVAIGNPFGLAHTVSVGILSAKGRTRDDVNGLDPSGYFNFLQTDASIKDRTSVV